jgi:2-oxoglutarate ferredoxin oxidoreductase subunit beta
MSTLCAGCGHDSVTAAIVRAFWELETPPHMIAKLSGIGCSSKTPTYFVSGAHGFNSAHGRMPAIASGANAANKDLTYIGSPATATRCPSAWARCATPSAAT